MTDGSDLKERLADLSGVGRAGLVSVGDAAAAWSASRTDAATRLARLAQAGWLSRVRRGLYYIVPLEAASGNVTTYPDSWVLASAVYSPCYIGGWSAAEHWALSEQLFRSTFVVTAASVRSRTQTLAGLEFRLARVRASHVQGLPKVWRGTERVSVSGEERTIVDGLREPSWLGGIRHLADCLRTYLEQGIDARVPRLLREIDRTGTGAAAKRLGFLLESLHPERRIGAALHGHVSKGLIKLDPSVRRGGRINKRWGLIVNATFD